MIRQVTHHLVGVAELAARWNISKQAVTNWRRKGLLPAPDVVLNATPVWREEDITAWEQSRRDEGKVIPGEEPRRRRTT